MNAGQMMMQTPVNAALSVAVPATPAMVILSAGDQQATDFAGLLAGMTPRPGKVTGTAKPVGGGAPAAKGISLDPMIQDAKVAIVAALRTTTAKAAQTEPSEAGVSKDQAEPVEVKVTGDVAMPQNVVLYASGALVAAEQQIIGRMPEQDPRVADQGGVQEMAMVVGVVDELKSATVAGNTLQPATPAAEVVLKSAEAPLPGVKVADVESDNVTPPKDVLQQRAVEPGAEAPSETVLTTTLARMEQTGAQAVPVQRSVAAEQPLPPLELPEQSAVKNEMNTDVQPKAATAPAETAVKGVAVEQRQVATAPVPGTITGEQAVTATVDQAVRIDVPEAPVVSPGSAVQQRVVLKKDANVVPPLQGGDAGLLTPETEDSAALAVKPMKDQAAVHPAEFRFSRSAAVEAAIGGNQQAGIRTPEKSMSGQENNIKLTVEKQSPEEKDGGFSDSNAGSKGKDFDGFVQQAALPVRPAVPNMTGIHQQFSVDTASATSPQALQPESPRPGSSEQIAVQVRDQLATHEIKSGSEQITIRLSPEHLGEIKVNIRLEDRNLKVEIVTENRFAKDSLLQHAESLKDSLARQNISMDKFEVTTGGSSTGNQGNNTQGEWRELAKNRQSQQWLASGGYRTPSADEGQKTQAYTARAENAVLDLHF